VLFGCDATKDDREEVIAVQIKMRRGVLMVDGGPVKSIVVQKILSSKRLFIASAEYSVTSIIGLLLCTDLFTVKRVSRKMCAMLG